MTTRLSEGACSTYVGHGAPGLMTGIVEESMLGKGFTTREEGITILLQLPMKALL